MHLRLTAPRRNRYVLFDELIAAEGCVHDVAALTAPSINIKATRQTPRIR